ncbi:hypothetical protein C8Q79DRAFT_1012994 [Trametes meyenii]|nr:hypothetical protein C8Q79DRAFT_1012994 [Trametes meyenii]
MSLPLHPGQPLTADQAACWLQRLIDDCMASVARLQTFCVPVHAQKPTYEGQAALSTHAGVLEQVLGRMCFFLPDHVVRAVVAIIVATHHQEALISSGNGHPGTCFILDADTVRMMVAYLEHVEARLLSDAHWVETAEGQDLLRAARSIDLQMHASRAAFAGRVYDAAGRAELAELPVLDGREDAWAPLGWFLGELQGLFERDVLGEGCSSARPYWDSASTSGLASVPRLSPELYSCVAGDCDDAPSPSSTACTDSSSPLSARQLEKSRSRSYEPSSSRSPSPSSLSSSSSSTSSSASSSSSPYPPVRLPSPYACPHLSDFTSLGSRKRRRNSEEHQSSPVDRKRQCIHVRTHDIDGATPSRSPHETQPRSHTDPALSLPTSSESAPSGTNPSVSSSTSGPTTPIHPSSFSENANAAPAPFQVPLLEAVLSCSSASAQPLPSSIDASSRKGAEDDEDVETVSDDMDTCSFVTTDSSSWHEFIVYDPAAVATSFALDGENEDSGDVFDTRPGGTRAPAPVYRSKNKRRCWDGILQSIRQFFIR